MGPLQDIEAEGEKNDRIHPKNIFNIKTEDTKAQQHLKLKKTPPSTQSRKIRKLERPSL